MPQAICSFVTGPAALAWSCGPWAWAAPVDRMAALATVSAAATDSGRRGSRAGVVFAGGIG
ncbi:MAG: hypothetical protein KDF63_05485, partial [Rhodoferax sp.]|nr:hypothetical protein [Rhodoferax sp.]